MEICSVSEILYLPAVAAAVRLVSHVHRAVEVAHKVDKELEGEYLLVSAEFSALESRNLLVDGTYYVSFLVEGSLFESKACVNVLVVPCAGVFILRCMACIVHPVCPIYDGFSVQKFCDLLVGFLREVSFCESTCYIMTFLAP